MFERVAIVGAGVAGLAAAWAAAQRGAQLRLFDASPGASCLAPGAIDDRPWEEVSRSTETLQLSAVAGPLPESVRVFGDDLQLWRLPAPGAPLTRLCTLAGRVRVARGHDKALLDLAQLPAGARVLLPRVMRAEWDADALAQALSADAYAASRRLRFEAVDAKLLKLVGEDRIASADLASRHDDLERRGWLAERVREMLARAGGADAVLVGPWLGALLPLASWLSRETGVRIGEALGDVGGAAGLRYEAARASLLETIGVRIHPYNVERIASAKDERDGALVLHIEDGDSVSTDSVVLALGGVAAGGVIYDPPEQHAGQDAPPAGGRPWRLSLDMEATLQAQGVVLDTVGSMHGPSLDQVAWPTDADPGFLESVGVRCEGLEVAGAVSARIFAAGDVVADKPRTVLQAVFSGIRAGAAAAGEPGALSA
jgi:glycerol-3-phosphate dehydrogenase subunit B